MECEKILIKFILGEFEEYLSLSTVYMYLLQSKMPISNVIVIVSAFLCHFLFLVLSVRISLSGYL